MGERKISIDSRLVGGREEVDPATGALSTPIVMSSTFHQDDLENFGRYDYSRSGNPTREAAESLMNELEGGAAGFCFASGMAAVSAVLSTLSQGDRIVAGRDVYGGSYRALADVFPRFGIETDFVDATDLDAIEAAITSRTKLLFLETPSNPLLRITDLKGACELARAKNIRTAVDNTFMTPLLQRPLKLGADYAIHSGTKFLGGHSDLVAGCVVAGDEEAAGQIGYLQNGLGAILSPHDSWLLMRGVRTLKVRMEAAQRVAGELAKRLAGHPGVGKVYYTGLGEHPGRKLHESQAAGHGAVVSFDVGSGEGAKRVLEGVRMPAVAVSLGGVETILSYPWAMSHAAMPPDRKLAADITPGLMRLSAGLEDVEDLWADLERVLPG